MEPVRWGVMGVARIAVKKVIPAMQKNRLTPVVAIASRDLGKAERAARELGIARAHGSYEELLADPAIDAIYNPLPNHLHAPRTIRAATAGKHVLCEKPVALNTGEVREMIAARDRAGVCIGEAFMVRTHPQWLRVRDVSSPAPPEHERPRFVENRFDVCGCLAAQTPLPPRLARDPTGTVLVNFRERHIASRKPSALCTKRTCLALASLGKSQLAVSGAWSADASTGAALGTGGESDGHGRSFVNAIAPFSCPAIM
ncbi:MAG: Gfo/Idh/MocA family oxidoreductase [Acidobacteria bacterium]|nr:Gfo/Idh/MocA family oxidoreductase [Acidobacteriota bacterium]